MARSGTLDFYQNYAFHLYDLSGSKGIASAMSMSGGGGSPGSVMALTPQLGFSSIAVPGYDIETEEIKAGNDPYPKTFVRSVSVDTVTLSRGVRMGDLEFYRWAMKAMFGRGEYRRTLGLVQLHGMINGESGWQRFLGATTFALSVFAAAGAVGGEGEVSEGLLRNALQGGGAGETVAGGAAAAAGAAGVNIPGARAWILYDCVPVRYDPAEADLSGEDDDITIMELELQPERFFEYSIPPGAAKGMGLV